MTRRWALLDALKSKSVITQLGFFFVFCYFGKKTKHLYIIISGLNGYYILKIVTHLYMHAWRQVFLHLTLVLFHLGFFQAMCRTLFLDDQGRGRQAPM